LVLLPTVDPLKPEIMLSDTALIIEGYSLIRLRIKTYGKF
jgi:hypothetical protein